VTGVLSTSYLSFVNVACCLGVIIGGVVAVQQYTSRSGAALESGDGAIMGAMAGAAGAVISTVLDRILKPIGLDSNSISRRMMEEWSRGMEGQGMPPEMMQSMEGEGTLLFVVAGTVFLMIVYAIFGAIGGALGTSFFQGNDTGTEAAPPPGPEGPAA